MESLVLLNKFKFVLLLGFLVNYCHAAIVDVLKTSILVENTTANDSLKLKQAFAQILANSTGETILSIVQNPIFSESNIKSGVKRSYFEKIDVKYLSNTKKQYYWFHLVMHKSFINKIIKQAGFSLLPHNREEIVLWVVEEDLTTNIEKTVSMSNDLNKNTAMGNEHHLKYAYDDEVLMYWLNHWATSLGLVFVMPVIDEDDMLFVTPESIQSLSFEAHQQSINRYDRNQSLLIYLRKTDDEIKVRSGLFLNNNDVSIKHFQQAAVELGEILYSTIVDVAEKYASEFKVNAIDLQQHTVQIVINSIYNYDAVNEVKKYLSQLSMIESYSIISATKGQLILQVELAITTEIFLQIVARDNVLLFDQNSSYNQLIFNHLIYIDE